MTYPITEFFADEGSINKDTFLLYNPHLHESKEKIKKYKIDTALFVFTKTFPTSIQDKLELLCHSKTASNDYPFYIYNKKFVLANIPIGAPVATSFMEMLGFLGITNFFACGSCGCINHKVDSSKFFLVKRAIRDEGISYKYQKSSVYTHTDKELTKFVEDYLIKNNFRYIPITTWTTDAFFRETTKAIEKRLKQGATSVEMECASWCAVAKFRGYKFAQLLYTSDITKQGEWSGFIDEEQMQTINFKIIDLMIKIVTEFIKKR